MGGHGSGRHWGFGKAIVEDGLTLNINKLVREGNIRPGRSCRGSLCWSRVPSGEEIGSLGYEADLINPLDAWMRLQYRVDGKPQDYRVPLESWPRAIQQAYEYAHMTFRPIVVFLNLKE